MAVMNREEQNRFLTQTGPGTAMGDLFRRYWMPALLAEELPTPDCPPVRVELLSEKLLAFRDSSGRLGLINEFCAHRGVSLWFGRNEEDGVRCPYHGWKFDVSGQCVEIPSEKPSSSLCSRIKLKSYPLVERGGVLWTYIGPEDSRPDLPEFEFAMVGDASRYISKRWEDCNYLQALEGGIDPNHVAFLHAGRATTEPGFESEKNEQHYRQDLEVKLEVEPSEGGMVVAYGRESGGSEKVYWRVQHFVMPNFTLIPPVEDHPIHGHFWVPINDHECWAWTFDYHPLRELTEREVSAFSSGRGLHTPLIPGTYRPVANKANDYLMDREKQRLGINYSGIDGIAAQDFSLQESQGPIHDRAKENLVSSDRVIVVARRILMSAAKSLADGVEAPGRNAIAQRVRSAATVLPAEVPVIDAVKDSLRVVAGTPYLTH